MNKTKKAQALSIARKCCQFVKGQRLNAVYTDGPDVWRRLFQMCEDRSVKNKTKGFQRLIADIK